MQVRLHILIDTRSYDLLEINETMGYTSHLKDLLDPNLDFPHL